MVDVFDQVEEELRSERYKRLARTWLPVAGGVLVVALIAALGWWGYQNWQISKADKASVAYQRGLESLEAGNPIGADAAFTQAANEGNGAYKSLSLQHRAAIAVQANRIPDAVALFDEAAKASGDPLIADPAALKAVWLLMDTAPLADIQSRLEPLIKEGRPMRAYAREALALAQIQTGQIDAARSALVVLKNELDTPQIVSERADAALASIDSGTAANLAAIVRAQAALEASAARAPAAMPAGSLAPSPAAPARP